MATVLDMSMSLDGYVAGPNVSVDNGLGDGGMKLHEWVFEGDGSEMNPTGVNGKVFELVRSTGAVVAGRGTFEPAGGWGGDHHDGVPIFILSRGGPIFDQDWPLVTYLDDVTEAMTRARDAAGDKDVLVHGAGIAKLALAAGELDEIVVHVVPVLLGEGRSLVDAIGDPPVDLDLVRVLEGEGGITHLHYRVRK